MLIFVRHGQTAVNAEGRLQGRLDAPLDATGREQARRVAAAIGSVDRVIASPLLRARQTAEAFQVPVTVDERFVEVDYGAYDGRKLDDPDVLELWRVWPNELDRHPAGGESILDVVERVQQACAELAQEAKTSDIAVVSHVTPIKAAVVWALRVDPAAIWRMYLATGSITRIGMSERGAVLRSFNEMPDDRS